LPPSASYFFFVSVVTPRRLGVACTQTDRHPESRICTLNTDGMPPSQSKRPRGESNPGPPAKSARVNPPVSAASRLPSTSRAVQDEVREVPVRPGPYSQQDRVSWSQRDPTELELTQNDSDAPEFELYGSFGEFLSFESTRPSPMCRFTNTIAANKGLLTLFSFRLVKPVAS
jgi:hypothetical protein